MARPKEELNESYKVTTTYGEYMYSTLDDVIEFIEKSRLETFTITQGDNDLTGVIYSTLEWRGNKSLVRGEEK